MRFLLLIGTLILFTAPVVGQSPGVPILRQDSKVRDDMVRTNAASLLSRSNMTLAPASIRDQLHRASCQIKLLKPSQTKLTAREVSKRARASYMRVGWYYLCTQCDQWRLTMAGGYVLTREGAVGTSYHVVEPPRDLREGCLIAADDTGRVFPIAEILAANRYSDACIIRIRGDNLFPLPLNTNSAPGDTVYCLSDPLGRRGYFSQGIVNRFFTLPEHRLSYVPGAPMFSPTRIDVSTDWSFGSSGAAVLDECANVIGHVSTLSVEGDEPASNTTKQQSPAPTIVFHEAVSARDVLALVTWPK